MRNTFILIEKYLCDCKYHCSNIITVIEHVIVKTSFGLVLWKGNLGGRVIVVVISGGSNYDSLFVRTVAFPVQVAYWIKEVIAPCGTSVPCQLWPVVRRHGRGVLLTRGDPCMTGCLECPLASPVFAQSWSQTATDGAWYSTTALLSGRDRPRCLCVLRPSGSEPKTRRTGKVATSLPSISLPVGARW